ncbi:hypothetical protein ACRN9G_03675 [Shewanella frigidimarina]|uniref:hypothetical protein n=1 Tax=Shewanella frigidimarina TaxID=56812 RepID=UPI003D7AF2D0
MAKTFLFAFIIVISFANAAGQRWDDSIDIDDPNLTINVAAEQCQKSLINAPEKLELWCEKAINMGYWRGLVPLSLHTGNGERLLKEATKRVNAKDPMAYSTLAWIYEGGMFVDQDINYAISLHKEFLSLDVELTKSSVTATHEELAKLYKKEQNWLAVSEHAQYVFDNTTFEFNKDYAARLMKLAQDKLVEQGHSKR